MIENKNVEYKSLKKVIGPKADLKSLAETCVCFANAQGGTIYVGIEDSDSSPPENQKIDEQDYNNVLKRLRDLTNSVGIVNPELLIHENGGQYISLPISPSTRVIATTSSGKVFIRISDNCFPVGSEEITSLAAEKSAFQWELIVVNKIRLVDADRDKVKDLVTDLRNSEKVSEFIKNQDTDEIFSHYQLISPDGYLTNQGILWVGSASQRARLSYPITVQYIVYNSLEEKIRKKEWHFHIHNPKEILLDIEREAVELNYTTEVPDGIYRKSIRHYQKEVIRELLVNAIAHQKYTTSGDIFIEVYPDRFSITSPGGFPLGIDSNNVLHERQRRNPHLIQLMSDLNLMEGEGSGFDLVYEKLARDAKPMPVIENDFNKVKVTVFANSINEDIIPILDYVDNHFELTQREYITLGIIAAEKKILTTKLTKLLQLRDDEKMRSWIGRLTDLNIIDVQGRKKGAYYLLNPLLFSQAKIGITPSLKTMEPHQLEALIIEDLKYNIDSSMSDIKKRNEGILEDEIQKTIYRLVKEGKVEIKGAKKNRTYSLSKKK